MDKAEVKGTSLSRFAKSFILERDETARSRRRVRGMSEAAEAACRIEGFCVAEAARIGLFAVRLASCLERDDILGGWENTGGRVGAFGQINYFPIKEGSRQRTNYDKYWLSFM